MRKIAVVSATRAEWYLLKNLCYEIEKDEDLSLQLFVSGTHLSKDFGLTYKEIQKEFKISKKIKILSKKNDSLALCKSLSKAISKFSKVFAKFKPDIVVILGDRYEMLGVASAALLMRIPIAHICGGELTLGAIDDSIRHSISKMASLHFVSTNTYKKRVLQLGEQEDRVFTVGSLGAENIARMNFLSKEELEKELKLSFEKRIFLITYHPQTLNLKDTKRDLELLLAFLEKQKDTSLIFTKANADENGILINKIIAKFTQKHKNAKLFDNLGSLRYLSLMKIADIVLGNSSSGILESPFFKTPCINIGLRQAGRLRAANIIDCEITELEKAYKKAMSKEFKLSLKSFENPFFHKDTSYQIKTVLKNINLDTILYKNFVDLKWTLKE